MRKKRVPIAMIALILAFGVASIWTLFKFTPPMPGTIWAHFQSVIHGDVPWDGGRSSREIIRYAEKRLEGHPKLEIIALPLLHSIQGHIERPVHDLMFLHLGKGAGVSPKFSFAPGLNLRVVKTSEQLGKAIYEASPGQVIEIQPGRYRFKQFLLTRQAGTPDHPIIVRAHEAGKVFIEFDTEEGFVVNQPHWVFENLHIKGVCRFDHNCEHAFHVVGKAQGVKIQNNHIEDFNAHIKVNGVGNDWPDAGVIEFNTLTNTHPRATDRPVTTVDIVAASRWVVADNVVTDFVKGSGDKISYGIFMKGAGRDGRIERNLVICSTQKISQPGIRVGISFGGGGSGAAFCRDRSCKAEFFSGFAVNNVIAHCNDFGIDIFRSGNVSVAHNTLINTAGIDVRVPPAAAYIYGNIVEGLVRARNGGKIRMEMNETDDVQDWFQDPDKIDMRWKKMPEKIPSLPSVSKDFCNRPRPDGTLPGAMEAGGPCAPDTGEK